MWKLLIYLKRYWRAVVAAPLFMLLEVCMDLLQPLFMAQIINEGVMAGDLELIQKTGGIMLGVALIGLLGGIGCTIFSSYAAQGFGADLRYSLFQKVQTFSFGNLDRIQTGSLITRLTNDVGQLQTLVQMTLRILVRAPLMVLGSLVMAIRISPLLALILAVMMPLLVVFMTILMRMAFRLYSKVQAKLDDVNNVVQENLTGIRVIKAFVRSAFEINRFEKANEAYRKTALKAARTIALNMPVMMFILNMSIVAVLWFGGARVGNQTMNIGELIAFINYVTQVLFSLLLIGMMMPFVSRAKSSAERINEVMELQPEIVDPERAKTGVLHSGEVEFEDVSFSYEGNIASSVIRNISFTAQSGQTVAILGATGSGKTSLVSLIPRLYDVTQGSVRIDGVDVRDMQLHDLRSRIGMVLQQPTLFSGSIRDNICFGKPDATEEEIVAAAKAADAHTFIMGLPDGYDSIIGQRGVTLSGGQKQRLSIARALLVRPAILILDDSTSAVDFRTEARIQKALKELMGTCTSFIIAQRISSVRGADHILVLEDGELVAQGTHEQLLHTSRIYQEIYQSQRGREESLHG
ncbi:ABC transporter ATP-binding protein/permease [Brevibacillus ruminantium]|uniref:ABC transporter ATP-binding protein/permease n=1 Tax=Brevibacillus ruminantium TaxID=2950604 RepID=A0ABY4WG67_9BACL|nr:ABC transporter ATP-binding protein [Brevibacillus ruminantium]USG65859.1 ABC transporter ATP-binding protein/permease [Brevibacillus ruminantium]